MRLITKQLWRAFPELDRFDDQRCDRFVAAAQRGKRAAAGRLLLNLILTACVAAAIGSLGVLVMWLFWDAGGGTSGPAAGGWRFAFGVSVLCLAIIAAGFASLVFRDQLLRRRVAHFIFARGKCPQCRYNLLGVRVPPTLRIACPECGLQLEVDAALTELADDVAAGPAPSTSAPGTSALRADSAHEATTTSPTPAPPPLRQLHLIRTIDEPSILPKWFTPTRRKKTRRIALILLALAVIVPAGIWAWNWSSLHAQARRAAAQRVGLAGIDKISESLNPPADGSPDAWDWLDRVFAVYNRAENEVRPEIRDKYDPYVIPSEQTAEQTAALLATQAPSRFYPDFSAIYDPDELRHDAFGQPIVDEDAPANREFATRMIERMTELGVDQLLEGMRAAPRAFMRMPTFAPGTQPDFILPHLGEARCIVETLAARMMMAHKSGDRNDFILALRSALSIVRTVERCPIVIHQLTAASLERMVLDCLRRLADAGLEKELLDSVGLALQEIKTGATPWALVMDAERQHMLESVRWAFSDTAIITTGVMPSWGNMSRPDLPMGTLDQNIEAVHRYFDALRPIMDSPAPHRGLADSEQPGFRVALTLIPNFERASWAIRSTATWRAGVRIMVAVERYKAAHGRPPESLENLVPQFLATIPTDPYAVDSRFRYRVFVLPEGPQGSSQYFLYSVGADFSDDGGVARRSADSESLYPHRKPGTDFVIAPDIRRLVQQQPQTTVGDQSVHPVP